MKDTVLYSGIPGLELYKIKLLRFPFKCKQHFSCANNEIDHCDESMCDTFHFDS